MAELRIAIVGAESTGKSTLAQDLAQALGGVVVAEVLREWCDREGRTPRPDEQAGIAAEQARRIEQAAADHAVVVADTTPLMTAVYSLHLFGDRSLHPMALDLQRRFDHTLLTALDLPWVADGLQRDGPHVREPVDALVREALAQGGLAWRVVHGSGPRRLASALAAIGRAGDDSERARREGQGWAWVCERCSDPDCEHRLFSGRLGLAR